MAIIYGSNLYTVVECEHAKLARGAAFCRVKLKNLKTAQVRECTLRDSDNIEEAFIEKRKLQYLYRSGHFYHFLDLETYEDLNLDDSHVGENKDWLKDNLELTGLFFEHKLIDLELPTSLELKVTETTPGFRGDTVKAGTKAATLETGIVIAVPLFITTGEKIKVDTRMRKYLGRA
ncbi:MAG: elongation factor P [Candidatus Omnitrophota bacterium]|nr:MAG: elongation factor P [Candidatus Omnitrophota bacterium]